MPAQVTKRNLCSELVSVTCVDGDGWWHAVPGNLEEIEEWSAVVLTDARIRPGTSVRIRCETNQLKGVVKTCTREELGFLVEVRLDADSKWSERWFTPQHLLALNAGIFRPKMFPRAAASGY